MLRLSSEDENVSKKLLVAEGGLCKVKYLSYHEDDLQK